MNLFEPNLQTLAQARDVLLTPFGLDESKLIKALGEIFTHRVDYADLYFQFTKNEGWSLEEGIVKTGSFSIDQGVGVRAVSGDKTAFSYSDEISERALLEAAAATRTIARHGDRFLDRIFTTTERRLADRRAHPAATYAKRFAAKEACAKALGTGFRDGIFFRDLGVVNLPSGRPTIELAGAALCRLRAIVPAGFDPHIDLAITDEYPMAHAFVVISAVQLRNG